MRIIEFYQCHTEVIQAWVDLLQDLKEPIEVYLTSGRDFKVFKSAVSYHGLEDLPTPLDEHDQYMINTTRVDLKNYPKWVELSHLETPKFLVFHSVQEFDYFRGQNLDLMSSRWVTPIFLCPAIRFKLSQRELPHKYLQLIPVARPQTCSYINIEGKIKYLVIGRLDFRIRDYEELIRSLQLIRTRSDWTCCIIGAISREEDYRRLMQLIRKAHMNDLIRVIPNCPTSELQLQLLPRENERIYLLPLIKKRSYYLDILSGVIPLSMSNNIPMILDRQLAQIYQITFGIIYDRLLEGIQVSLKLDSSSYQDLVRGYHDSSSQVYQSNVSMFGEKLGRVLNKL